MMTSCLQGQGLPVGGLGRVCDTPLHDLDSVPSWPWGALLGWRAFRAKTRTGEIWAAFLWGLPISPVLFSLIVLGVTYL